MWKSLHRLEIAEYLFLALSGVGSLVAAVSGKVIYMALPLLIYLLLNLMNRYRFEQRTRRRTNTAMNRVQQQLATEIQALKQTIEAGLKPSANVPEAADIAEIKQAIAALQIQAERFYQGEALDLQPIYQNLSVQKRLIASLQDQYASFEESLKHVINYLNTSLPTGRVENVEKAIAQLSSELAKIPSQIEQIDQRLTAIQTLPALSSSTPPSIPKSTISPQLPAIKETVSSPAPVSTENPLSIQSRTWNCISTLSAHSDWVRSVAISFDGQTLASGSFDKTVKLWKLPEGELIHSLSQHTKGVFAVAISPDNKILASGSWDETIKLWQIDTGALLNTLNGHTGSVRSLAITPEGQTLVSGSFDKTIKLWNLETGALINTLSKDIGAVSALAQQGAVAHIALSPNAEIIVSGGDDGVIQLWQLETGEPISVLTGNLSCICSLTISPDNQILAAGSINGAITFWQLNTRELLGVYQAHSAPIMAAVFSPDGQTVISGSTDGTLKIWSVWTDKQLQVSCLDTLEHSDAVMSITISGDGKTLAAGSADGKIKIWRCD